MYGYDIIGLCIRVQVRGRHISFVLAINIPLGGPPSILFSLNDDMHIIQLTALSNSYAFENKLCSFVRKLR